MRLRADLFDDRNAELRKCFSEPLAKMCGCVSVLPVPPPERLFPTLGKSSTTTCRKFERHRIDQLVGGALVRQSSKIPLNIFQLTLPYP